MELNIGTEDNYKNDFDCVEDIEGKERSRVL